MSDEALQAAQTAPEPSSPVEEVKPKAEEGDHSQEQPKAEPEADKPQEPTEADKVKTAMQKRIDRLTAATKAEAEKARQLQAQIAELSAKLPKADDAPKQDDYATYEEWEQARIKYEAKKIAAEEIKAAKDEELKVLQEKQAQEVRRQFDEKEKSFRTTVSDYDRVAAEAVETMTSLATTGVDIGPLRDVVMQFDNPPEMIYQLGKDTSLIEELVTMPPLKAMRELVKLENALKGTAKAEPEKAPEPIKPVGGKGGTKPIAQRSGKEVLAFLKQ